MVVSGGVEQNVFLRASWNCFFCVPAFMQGWVTQGDSKISSCYFWYWSRVSWLLQLNSGAGGLGKHLTIQLSCLLCLPSRWVSPWVLGVTQENKDPALVWIKGKPRWISYWAEWHLESCQESTMELPRENSQRSLYYICKKDPTAVAWLNSKGVCDCKCCKDGL